MDVRAKMVNSGNAFELTVGGALISSFNCRVLYNKRFYSETIHRGRECDVLLITPHTIYCIECKNYKGFISCDYFKDNWKFASSGKISFVQNPYLSNLKRIRAIRGNMYGLGILPYKIKSVIVVPNRCKIHNKDTSICPVVGLTELLSMVRFDETFSDVKYDVDAVTNFLFSISCN